MLNSPRLYFLVLACYVAVAVTITAVQRLAGSDVAMPILMVATVALLLFFALVIGHRIWTRPVAQRPGWLPISAGLVAALVAMVLLNVLGVPPPYPRAIAVVAFGVAAYPFVREINEQTLPFPLYCLLWMTAAAGMVLFGSVTH